MAKKNESQRSFLNAPLPQENKKYKSTRVTWGGLNLSNSYNSGELSYADGVSTSRLPYLQTDTALIGVKYDGMVDYNKDGYTVLGAYQNSDLFVIVYSVNTIELNGDTPVITGDPGNHTVITEYGCIATGKGLKHALMSDIIDVSPTNGEYSIYADVYVKDFDVYKATWSKNGKSHTFDRKEKYKRFKFTLCQYPSFYVISQTEDLNPEEALKYQYVYRSAIYQGNRKGFDSTEEAVKFCKANFGINELRSLSIFNIYKNPSDPVGTDIDHRVLIFPDKCSLPSVYKGLELTYDGIDRYTNGVTHAYDVFGTEYESHALYYCLIKGKYSTYDYEYAKFEYNSTPDIPIMWPAMTLGTYPDIIKAVTKDSRLYGITTSDIYVSGFNDYANMNLDTVLYSNSAGAWMVTTKASEESTGIFTAIYPFAGSVVAFKEDFMYTVTGTVNPFRLNEIGNVGCVDMRSVCDEDGRLYFAARNGIYMYRDGYLPACISTQLMLDSITKAVAYMENHRYHVNISGAEYIYDTLNGTWTRNNRGMEYVAVTNKDIVATDGNIYNLSRSEYRKRWKFATDYMNGYTSDIKKLCKLQLMYEISRNANIYIYINTDKGEEIIYRFENTYRESKVKCARVLLRISDLVNYSIGIGGNGYCKIHSLELISEGTSEMYVED